MPTDWERLYLKLQYFYETDGPISGKLPQGAPKKSSGTFYCCTVQLEIP